MENLELTGQLWEPCECGREPIYMSAGGVCEVCARQGRHTTDYAGDIYGDEFEKN